MDLLYKQQKVCETHPYDDTMKAFGEAYKTFLNTCKTERETVNFFVAKAEEKGFTCYQRGQQLKAGDKVYRLNGTKGVLLAVIGNQSLEAGCNLTAAHVDAPRIDIRNVPVYEDTGLAMMKTHYYGGIKKYHWLAMPLELRGVVFTKDGEKVEISIGQNPSDPVFTITDLLPHLGKDQMVKPAGEVVTGEGLNIIVGATPSKTDEKDSVKLFVLEHLYSTYGITEEDFISAELSLVPAISARDVGFDKTMIGGYGQDDRVCAYTTANALFDMAQTPEKTCICALVDKEEIGSAGTTGMKSQHFDTFVEDLCESTGARLRVCYENSFCMSADVTNAYDPNFAEASERNNDAKLSNGLAVLKYTGGRGKSGASDASAETMSKVRKVLGVANVSWQTGQIGRLDLGGGGTVAHMVAERNIETVDAGVPVLSMHAPFEVVSKLDVYMAYCGYKAMFENM